MILAALLLQAAALPAKPPPTPVAAEKPAAPKLRPLDAATAVETFRAICWAHFRERDDLRAAVVQATIPLAEVPRGGHGETWRADEAILTYLPADGAPPNVPAPQCTLRTRLAGAADQLVLAARIATALGLGNGRTQTGRGSARTTWDVRQPDARIARLIATTVNASGGQTELRLQALLLAAR